MLLSGTSLYWCAAKTTPVPRTRIVTAARAAVIRLCMEYPPGDLAIVADVWGSGHCAPAQQPPFHQRVLASRIAAACRGRPVTGRDPLAGRIPTRALAAPARWPRRSQPAAART